MVGKITPQRLYNIALSYLTRYESSTQKLKNVLERRILSAQRQGKEIPKNASQWIHETVLKMQELGYVNNKRYAENTIRRLSQSGKSIRYMNMKLKQDGIDSQTFQSALPNKTTDDIDLDFALLMVKKKKIGFYRPFPLQKQYFQKDLAILGRAGFSYETAQRALKGDSD